MHSQYALPCSSQNLFEDFRHSAETYGMPNLLNKGKIIISEVQLRDEDKTIKPLSLGGAAGGLKFKVQV